MFKKNEKLGNPEEATTNYASNGAVAATNINAPVTIHNITQNQCNRNTILSTIFSSSPDDWHYDDDNGVYTYSQDVALQIRTEHKDEFEPFPEPRVESYSDPDAFKELYYIYYNENQIDKYSFVSVDGCRMSIPYPKSCNDLRITQEQYTIGRIINIKCRDSFEEYLKRAKITIIE